LAEKADLAESSENHPLVHAVFQGFPQFVHYRNASFWSRLLAAEHLLLYLNEDGALLLRLLEATGFPISYYFKQL